jgi:hypothetical protein
MLRRSAASCGDPALPPEVRAEYVQQATGVSDTLRKNMRNTVV